MQARCSLRSGEGSSSSGSADTQHGGIWHVAPGRAKTGGGSRSGHGRSKIRVSQRQLRQQIANAYGEAAAVFNAQPNSSSGSSGGGSSGSDSSGSELRQLLLNALQGGDVRELADKLGELAAETATELQRAADSLEGAAGRSACSTPRSTPANRAASMVVQSASNNIYQFALEGHQFSSGAADALRQKLPLVLQHGEPHQVARALWGWAELRLPLEVDAALVGTALLRVLPRMSALQVTASSALCSPCPCSGLPLTRPAQHRRPS